MKAIADVCIIPMGAGLSLSPFIAACEKVFAETGLRTELHANGTNLEGEWDAVMGAVKRCHEVLHGMGAARIHTEIRVGTRVDKEQTMADKVASVQEKM